MPFNARTQNSSSQVFQHSEALSALNLVLSQSSTRASGSAKVVKVKVPKPVYPSKFNERYTLPTGIEEQPF
jgi:hypothetical protein